MTRTFTIGTTAALLLLVSSCASVPPSVPAPTPLATPLPAPLAAEGSNPGDACRAVVASTAARAVSETSVISVDSSRAGAGVKVALKGAERPWSCIVGPDGVVKNVMYMGEG